VPDQNEEQRAPVHRQWERQYEIDRITAQYAEEHRSGRVPHVEEYVRRYPEYAREILEFAVYYHTVGFETEALDDPVDPELSPAAEKALTRIREQWTASTAAPPISGLVKQGAKLGYSPRTLADAVGLTTELLGKLEARAIAIATIPSTLIRRFAATLRVAPEAVAAYLGQVRPGQTGAFYYAEQPPALQQEAFLDAVNSSALSPDLKREWADIVRDETGEGD
jgi:hypothetical protein